MGPAAIAWGALRHMLAVMCELSKSLPTDFVDEDGSG